MKGLRSACLCGVAALTSCRPAVVAHEQAEREANRIVVSLHRAGITARKRSNGTERPPRFDVLVPSALLAQALETLELHDLPRPEVRPSRDLFSEAEFVPSTLHEHVKRMVGTEGDLTQALRGWPGVSDVRVVVSWPRDPRPGQEAGMARAAVLIVVEDASAAPLLEDIERFVRSKLPVTSPAEVFVRVVQPASTSDPTQRAISGSPSPPRLKTGDGEDTVDSGSRGVLARTVSGGLGGVVGVGALVVYMRYRRRIMEPL
ncbi:MAG: hypothetical protein ACFB9M_18230 [Myxococcota bacterium]